MNLQSLRKKDEQFEKALLCGEKPVAEDIVRYLDNILDEIAEVVYVDQFEGLTSLFRKWKNLLMHSCDRVYEKDIHKSVFEFRVDQRKPEQIFVSLREIAEWESVGFSLFFVLLQQFTGARREFFDVMMRNLSDELTTYVYFVTQEETYVRLTNLVRGIVNRLPSTEDKEMVARRLRWVKVQEKQIVEFLSNRKWWIGDPFGTEPQGYEALTDLFDKPVGGRKLEVDEINAVVNKLMVLPDTKLRDSTVSTAGGWGLPEEVELMGSRVVYIGKDGEVTLAPHERAPQSGNAIPSDSILNNEDESAS